MIKISRLARENFDCCKNNCELSGITFLFMSSSRQENHKWQIDLNPVNDDATADINKRCASLKKDFNPYKVFVEVGIFPFAGIGFVVNLCYNYYCS